MYPDALPALQCTTFWVLDVDVPHPSHRRQIDGMKALKELEAKYGKLPATFTVRTPTGGYHFYFNLPRDGRKIGCGRGRLPEGFDVKGEGGYVIHPRAETPNGKYEAVNNCPIADAPEWLIDLILNRAPVQAMPDTPPVLEADNFPVEQSPTFMQADTKPERRIECSKIDHSKPDVYKNENGDVVLNFKILLDGATPAYYGDPATLEIRRDVKRTIASQILREINLHPERIFARDNCGRGYVCPVCRSGTGSTGTGMSANPKKRTGETYNTPHLTCWNCNQIQNNTVFDIIGIMNGIDPTDPKNFWPIMDKAAPLYGHSIEAEVERAMQAATAKMQAQSERVEAAEPAQTTQPAQTAPCPASSSIQATATAPAQPAQMNTAPVQSAAVETALKGLKRQSNQRKQEEPEIDYTAYFEECVKRLNQTDYHRGLSEETLALYNVGYDPEWKSPKAAAGVPATPRLIIPTSKYSYLARDTRPIGKIRQEQFPYIKQKEGREHFFNFDVLDNPTLNAVFVVEGEIDALSLLQNSMPALALGGTGKAGDFLTALEKRLAAGLPVPPFVLALDNDTAGQGAQAVLRTGLKGRALAFVEMEMPDGCKDPNEALVKDNEALCKACQDAVIKAQEAEEELKEKLREQLRSQCAGRALDDFLADTRGREAVFYPTGVRELDKLLDGGLYAGLYIVGAISSLGKTTFALSIADNIAASGQDVLIFSLEMARNELIAKSVSRLTAKINLAYGQRTRRILAKDKGTHDVEAERTIQAAFAEYRQIGEHLYISEGIGNIGVEQVRAQVQNHTRIMGKPPVVLIDYLQILAPADPRSTDKQNTDKAVLELKRISRDFSTPVFAISSFNRDNYAQSVSMVAFKESGAIEYSSDVLIGMQYNGMDDPAEMLAHHGQPFYINGSNAKVDNVRLLAKFWQGRAGEKPPKEQEIQIKVLKNRNGNRGECVLKFWPAFNYFEDLSEKEEAYRRRDHAERVKQAAEERERREKKKALKRKKEEEAEAEAQTEEEAQAQPEPAQPFLMPSPEEFLKS